MKNFIITELKKDYKVLITLLNYEVPISKCLKKIKLKKSQKITTLKVKFCIFLAKCYNNKKSEVLK